MPEATKKIVIAHRGASGYIPEHTLASKAMAHAMFVDFIEQDLVLSKDDVPIVIHDIHLETVSDVGIKFPKRKRQDGRYYVIDFTFDELLTLNISERFDPATGKAIYPNRFPVHQARFKLHSLQDEIELIQGLNKSTGLDIGIYPEIKEPKFHKAEGKDISSIVLEVLKQYGYATVEDKCILQCFDSDELYRIRKELNCKLFLVQLTDAKVSKQQIAHISTYANGIGPWYGHLTQQIDGKPSREVNELVKNAHAFGLKVHAYTFRADDLGDFKSFESLLDFGFNNLELDGLFTDFPDKAVKFLNN